MLKNKLLKVLDNIANKKFYFIILGIMCVSVMLLGFSYSKESGTNESDLVRIENDDFKVTFSLDREINTNDKNNFDVSVVNRSNEESSYYMVLNVSDDKKNVKLLYSINGSGFNAINNGLIFLGSLKPSGSDGDFLKKNIEIVAESGEYLKISLDVIRDGNNLLANTIKTSNSVYVDLNGDYRYYGDNVNNYVIYNKKVYRIIGIIDNKVRLLDQVSSLEPYQDDNNYLSFIDYLYSFSSSNNVNASNVLNYHGWMMTPYDFWVNEYTDSNYLYFSSSKGLSSDEKDSNHYVINVLDIDINTIIKSGEGTKAVPYEVSYDSK